MRRVTYRPHQGQQQKNKRQNKKNKKNIIIRAFLKDAPESSLISLGRYADSLLNEEVVMNVMGVDPGGSPFAIDSDLINRKAVLGYDNLWVAVRYSNETDA